MARVVVRFFATAREIAGIDSIEVEALDVSDLLRVLGVRLGTQFSKLTSSMALDPDPIVILINGRNPGRSRVLYSVLREGDEVAIFPPVSGG